MEKLKNLLNSIGFGKNEIEVYIALLNQNNSTALEISRKTGLHRPNVYDALEKLLNEGLVTVVSEPKKIFIAKSPGILKELLNQKQQELDNILKTNILSETKKQESKVGISKGKLSLRDELFSFIKNNEPIYSYGVPSEIPQRLGPLLDEFNKERKINKIPMKIIFNSTAKKLAKFHKKQEYTEARFIPSKYDSKAATFISKNETLLVIWEPELTAIKILDSDVAEAYRNYFNILWKYSCC